MIDYLFAIRKTSLRSPAMMWKQKIHFNYNNNTYLVANFCLDLFQGSLRKHTATGLQVTEPETGMLTFTLVFPHIPVFLMSKCIFWK